MYSPYLNQTEPLKIEAQKFVECIQYRKESESSGRDGLNVVRVLEAASKSLKEGGGRVLI
jgi:predicted dehydrogenase